MPRFFTRMRLEILEGSLSISVHKQILLNEPKVNACDMKDFKSAMTIIIN